MVMSWVWETMNRVELKHVDTTPQGYALRILRAYRTMCDERYVVYGLSPETKAWWDMLNQLQVERAADLDRAIANLEEAAAIAARKEREAQEC